jgi:hypothetical protein
MSPFVHLGVVRNGGFAIRLGRYDGDSVFSHQAATMGCAEVPRVQPATTMPAAGPPCTTVEFATSCRTGRWETSSRCSRRNHLLLARSLNFQVRIHARDLKEMKLMKPLQVILYAGMISALSLTAWAQSSAPVPKHKPKKVVVQPQPHQTYEPGHDPIILRQEGNRHCEASVGGVMICMPYKR